MLDIFDEDKSYRSISTSSRGKSSSSITARWGTAALLSSITRTPTAGAISCACGCATTGAVPTLANIDIAAALAEAEEQYRARNPKSLAHIEEACAAMPGGNTRSAIYVEPFPLTMASGEGARLWDLDGHEYVDFLSEFTAGLYGHSHPAIRQAIDAALDGGVNFGAQGRPRRASPRRSAPAFPRSSWCASPIPAPRPI